MPKDSEKAQHTRAGPGRQAAERDLTESHVEAEGPPLSAGKWPDHLCLHGGDAGGTGGWRGTGWRPAGFVPPMGKLSCRVPPPEAKLTPGPVGLWWGT